MAGLVVGLFTAGIGDYLLQAGARLSRYGDDVGDVAGLGRCGDEVRGLEAD